VAAAALARKRNLMRIGRERKKVVVGIKKFNKLNISMRIFFTLCLVASLQLGCAQKKAESCLDYSFGKEYPYAFKFHSDKIIIGDGRKLIGFNRAGKEISRIELPTAFSDGQVFLDFLPLNDTTHLITVYARLYQITPKTQKLLNPNFGELLKGDVPIVTTAFQEDDVLRERTVGGIKVLNTETGRLLKYPTKEDLGNNNFELLDEYIALCAPDDSLCLLPLDTTKTIKKFPTQGFYSFLGIDHGNFVFSTRDYNKKEDHLHFYDADMKFVKEGVLDASYDEISDVVKKDGNFYMEAPFGNFFSFDKNTNTVYVFRHTKKNGICFFPIEDHLRVIKKAN
jgi:hypothetical protein